MNQKRIEINGVWYVREDSIKNTPKIDFQADTTVSKHFTYENDELHLEASILKIDGYYKPDTLSIEITDKRPTDRNDWKTDYWDSNDWMWDLSENNEEAENHVKQYFSDEGMQIAKDFINYLISIKVLE